MRRIALGLVGVALAVAPAGAHAAAWGVSNTTDTPVGQACPGFTGCSLREAVTSTEANPGSDAILVGGGTYPLTNGELDVTQDLTVSRVGAGAAVVSGSDSSRIFSITGSGTSFDLRFMALTHGSVSGVDPALGGAIEGGSGTTIAVESSTISNSSVSADHDAEGGAIYSNGSVTIGTASGSITGSSISGNSATAGVAPDTARGGGVAVSGGTLTVGARTSIANNQATDSSDASTATGGGVYADSGATFNGVTVSGNTAAGGTGLGGGVAIDGGLGTFVRSTASGNSATSAAGGVQSGGGGLVATASGAGSVGVQFSTISGNTASTSSAAGAVVGGGGLGALAGATPLTASNSTIASNSVSAPAGSTAVGSGAWANGNAITLDATILANNTGGSQCDAAALTSAGYDVLGPLGTCSYTAGTGDVTGVADALLKPLANNGGLTQTMALQNASPALDLIPGADSLCTIAATDQRGIARPQNGSCDTGSVEMRPATMAAAPTSFDFGQTPLSQPLSHGVSVSNDGDLDLSAPNIATSPPFSATGCTSAVAGGGSCTLNVGFAPTAGGVFSGQVDLTSGSLSDSVSLTGIGWAPTRAPVIKGAPSVGYKSGLYRGGWPAALARISSAHWIRCDADGTSNCTDIPGATNTAYRTVLADDGHTLRVRLEGTSTSSVTSDEVLTGPSAVVTRTLPTNYGRPVIKYATAPVAGHKLGVYAGQWTGAPTSYSFQWIRCDADGTSNCVAIHGITHSVYKPGTDDVGHTLRADVTATNPAGTSDPVRTAPSGVVGSS